MDSPTMDPSANSVEQRMPGRPAVPDGRSRRFWPWIIVLTLVGAAAAFALTVPIGRNDINSELRALNSEENEYSNKTDGYTLPVPADWRIFEESLFRERSDLSADEIRELLSSCGPSCAAFSIVKMGNYRSTACAGDSCATADEAYGAALTVYGYANPAGLDLDAFLEQALMKPPEGTNIYAVFFGEDESSGLPLVEGRMERIFSEDEVEMRTYFFPLPGSVYVFEQDMRYADPEDAQAVFDEMQRAVGLFNFE